MEKRFRSSRFLELGMPPDTAVHPESRADSRALLRELRSRSQRESGARPDHDAFDAVPGRPGMLCQSIARSLHSDASRSKFPCLRRTDSRNFRCDLDQRPVRQRPGRLQLHFPVEKLIPAQPAQPGSVMGLGPSTRLPHCCRGRSSLITIPRAFPAASG